MEPNEKKKINNTKNKKIVTELFLRGRKLYILLVIISQSYFRLPKTKRLNSTLCFIMKLPNKRELQHKASNHSNEIDF